jgi:hypothetical protein
MPKVPDPGDLRSTIQKKLDRVTYFSDEPFDEETVGDFRGVMAHQLDQYIEQQRRDNMPVNLCDFAFDLIYQLGRTDMRKEIGWRRELNDRE